MYDFDAHFKAIALRSPVLAIFSKLYFMMFHDLIVLLYRTITFSMQVVDD